MKYILKAEKVVFENQPGYMLHQFSGKKCVISQFIRAEDFENFLSVAGINQNDIVFI